jgi:Right handed beta helix region
MKSHVFGFALLSVAAIGASVPAQAASTRTFVSSSGVDTNPCTITQPCATFAVAYANTLPNGIIAALDPGKYGPITISSGVTINGNGWAAITGPANGTAVRVGAGSNDVIKLSGLEIDGANSSTDGIAFVSGKSLIISNCVIRQFVYGVVLNASASAVLLDSEIEDNQSYGVYDAPLGSNSFTFAHVRFLGNSTGLALNAGNALGARIFATGSDSIFAANNTGIDVLGDQALLVLDSVRIMNNNIGINNEQGNISLTHSTLSGNTTGYTMNALDTAVNSFGNNTITLDQTNSGTLTEEATR